MKKSEIIKLKIGDKLFKYVILLGIAEYKVIEIQKLKGVYFYEIECQNCKHDGEKCKVLVTQIDDTNQFRYVAFLNKDNTDELHYIHSDEEYPYFISIEKCKESATRKTLKYYDDKIEKINIVKKRYKEMIAKLQSIKSNKCLIKLYELKIKNCEDSIKKENKTITKLKQW